MEHYVRLDISLKLTAICIVDRTGKIQREGVVPSDPEAIAAFIESHSSNVARVGLEAGATSTWLWTELNKLGLPVICINARHAKTALTLTAAKLQEAHPVGLVCVKVYLGRREADHKASLIIGQAPQSRHSIEQHLCASRQMLLR
jgi:transposase